MKRYTNKILMLTLSGLLLFNIITISVMIYKINTVTLFERVEKPDRKQVTDVDTVPYENID